MNSTLAIKKAVLTVTADNKSWAYGVANPTFTASYGGFKNSATLGSSGVSGAPALSTLATSASPIGTYTIGTAIGTLTSANYSFAFADGTLTIGKATASVVVAAASKVYGSSDPTFTGTVSGLVAADGITVAYSRVAGETVGSYLISATLSPAAALANYDLTNTLASLTITKAALTVVADNKTKVYGQANPALTGTLTGVVAGDNITATYTWLPRAPTWVATPSCRPWLPPLASSATTP